MAPRMPGSKPNAPSVNDQHRSTLIPKFYPEFLGEVELFVHYLPVIDRVSHPVLLGRASEFSKDPSKIGGVSIVSLISDHLRISRSVELSRMYVICLRPLPDIQLADALISEGVNMLGLIPLVIGGKHHLMTIPRRDLSYIVGRAETLFQYELYAPHVNQLCIQIPSNQVSDVVLTRSHHTIAYLKRLVRSGKLLPEEFDAIIQYKKEKGGARV